jgi:hypothetical protein
MRSALGILVLALTLAGCVSAEERAAAISKSDDDQCRSYGAEPGTDRYTKCRMKLNQQRQATNLEVTSAIFSRPPY